MVVLYYTFLPRDDCPNETAALQTAIDGLAEKTPVVFGLYSWTEGELRDSRDSRLIDLLSRLKAHGFSEHDQVVAPSDIKEHGSLVTSGLDRLDCDTRKIPVVWRSRLYTQDGSIANSSAVPTISLAAARAYDDTIDQQLAAAFRRRQNPFTSFAVEEKFRPVMARDILAGPVPRNKWNLASKIVVVGDYSGDIHESALGPVPGYVLQANYVESLLDDRYFFGLGPLWTPVVTFVCLLIVALIFDRSQTPKRALYLAGFF